MPRRRKVATGASLGTLLADLRADQAKAEADDRKAASERSKDYVRIVNNYAKDGSASYEITERQLKDALKNEPDPELKALLEDYLIDIKTTKQSREINNTSDDFTYGRITYDEYKRRMEGHLKDTANDLVRQAIGKNLDAARVTENTRLVSKWRSDYSSGRMPFEEYAQKLQGLRADPSQKSPAEIEKITQEIDAAQQNEQALEDNKAWVAYQSNPTSGTAAAAQAYFNKRLAESKNPKDADKVEQYLKALTSSETARGKAVGAGSAAAANAAEDALKEYDKRVFDKAIAGANGDPLRVIDAFEKRSQFVADNLVQYDPTKFVPLLRSAGQAAMQAASDAVFAYNKDLIEKDLAKADDKNLDRQARLRILADVAAAASKVETNRFLMTGHETFVDFRQDAAERILNEARMARGERDKSEQQIKDTIGAYYNQASKKVDYDKEGKIVGANRFLKNAMDSGVLFDGSAEDQERLASWVMADPAARIGQLYNAAGETESTSTRVVGELATGQTISMTDKANAAGEQKAATGFADILGLRSRSGEEADNAFRMYNEAAFPGLSRGKWNMPDIATEKSMLDAQGGGPEPQMVFPSGYDPFMGPQITAGNQGDQNSGPLTGDPGAGEQARDRRQPQPFSINPIASPEHNELWGGMPFQIPPPSIVYGTPAETVMSPIDISKYIVDEQGVTDRENLNATITR